MRLGGLGALLMVTVCHGEFIVSRKEVGKVEAKQELPDTESEEDGSPWVT